MISNRSELHLTTPTARVRGPQLGAGLCGILMALSTACPAVAQTTWSQNGHAYQLVMASSSWTGAAAAAQAMVFEGQSGYLATITSAAESAFLVAQFGGTALNTVWIGGSDAQNEGTWRWVTGPEAGSQFWMGGVAGAPPSGQFANWGSNEPNNFNDEDYACWSIGTWGPTLAAGQWVDANDLGVNAFIVGYLVEFDCPTASVSLTAGCPAGPHSLGGPQLQFGGLPALGTTFDIVGTLVHATPFCLLLVGDPMPAVSLAPLGSFTGSSVCVAPLLVISSMAAVPALVSIALPSAPTYCGLRFEVQWVDLDVNSLLPLPLGTSQSGSFRIGL